MPVTFDSVRNKFRSKLNLDYRPAILTVVGPIRDVSNPSHVFVQEYTSNGLSRPRSVFLPMFTPIKLQPGVPVKLGKDDHNRDIILAGDSDGAVASGADPLSMTLQFNEGKTTQDDIQTLRCVAQSPASLVVGVRGWAISSSRSYDEFVGAAIDLSTANAGGTWVPSAGNMRYVAIAVKSDHVTLEAYGSTPKLLTDPPLNKDDVRECLLGLSANSTPVRAFMLIGGQTAITQDDIEAGKDLRQLVNNTPDTIMTNGASASVSNTAVETSLLATLAGEQTYPADALSMVGRSLRITAWGYIGDTGTPTLRIRAYLGSTVILDTTAITLTSLTGNKLWKLEAVLTVQVAGSSGQMIGQGQFTYNGGTTDIIQTSQTGVDFTATQLVDLTAQWGTANPSNTIVCTNAVIETLN